MDNPRTFGEDLDSVIETDDDPRMESPPDIAFDERRMHVRAYNYWVSLLDGRSYPSIEDLDPESIDDFGPHSVLLDFTAGAHDPAIAYLGRELRRECNLGPDIRHISDVPRQSLLSRLTDHFMQIIANCAPIGFEAEFVNDKGSATTYRGILMPLSSDGDTIDFIYGVINWKELADGETAAEISEQVDQAIANPPTVEASPIWADGPHSEADLGTSPLPAPYLDEPDTTLELGVHYREDTDEHDLLSGLSVPADAGLIDRLSFARETAEALRKADSRSRAALYRALGEAYDFALAAEAQPEHYAEILEDAGLKAQDRAPMTPIVKLVFGADYDKTRLTEFAAALSYGRRQDMPAGGLAPFLESFEGGLKGVVKAERDQRRTRPKVNATDQTRASLRQAAPLAIVEVEAGEGEFVLLLARREDDGRLAIVAPVAADEKLLDRAISKSS